MNLFLALFFLGIIQGLTEFLPVSSSGHLVLFSKLFGIEESLFFSILLHFATLLSILVIFRKDIWEMIKHPFSQKTIQIAVATIPTCIIVLVLMPIIKMSFAGKLLPICFALSAFLLLFAEKFNNKNHKTKDYPDLKEIDYKSAFWIGVAQGFAVFPGISRSGSTISAGLLQGKDKKEVAKFSFLMSIPVIFLSLIMEIYEIVAGKEVVNIQIFPTIIAFLAAFLVGIFAIKVMIKLTEKANLKWFSLYLAIISIVSVFII